MRMRLLACVVALGASMATAPAASADHTSRSRPSYQNVSRPHDRGPRHGRHHDRYDDDDSSSSSDRYSHYRPRRYYRSGHRYSHGYGHRRRYGDRHVEYRCAVCRHSYHDYGVFRGHLHDHHHIPIWRIPHVIVHTFFGWIFYG